jgi:hypothetical protein
MIVSGSTPQCRIRFAIGEPTIVEGTPPADLWPGRLQAVSDVLADRYEAH